MPVFPVAKLGYMALKQAGKPLANYMKRKAKTSALFRDRFCIPVAQLYHRWDTNVRMTNLGLTKPVKGSIKPLNETLAVDLGAEMIGEFTVFLIGAVVLYIEYYRQSRKAEKEQLEEGNYLKTLSDNITNLNVLVERQDAQLRELNRRVINLNSEMFGIKTALRVRETVEKEMD